MVWWVRLGSRWPVRDPSIHYTRSDIVLSRNRSKEKGKGKGEAVHSCCLRHESALAFSFSFSSSHRTSKHPPYNTTQHNTPNILHSNNTHATNSPPLLLLGPLAARARATASPSALLLLQLLQTRLADLFEVCVGHCGVVMCRIMSRGDVS